MQFHLTFRNDGQGWLVRGLPRDPACRFAELFEALDHAKHECAAEPATIELFVDGRYIVTSVQERGWPRPLCRPGAFRDAASDSVSPSDRSPKIQRSVSRLPQRLASTCAKWLRLRQIGWRAERGGAAKLMLRR